MSFQVKQFRMRAPSLFGKRTEETVPQTELTEKGLCKEYLFHSHPLCVWQHVTCVFRGCHGWGSLIDSSVGPVVHTVAVGGSNSFYFHLVINYLLSTFNNAWVWNTLSMATFVTVFGWMSNPCSSSKGNVSRSCITTLKCHISNIRETIASIKRIKHEILPAKQIQLG